MKKIVRLSENKLVELVKKVISEQQSKDPMDDYPKDIKNVKVETNIWDSKFTSVIDLSIYEPVSPAHEGCYLTTIGTKKPFERESKDVWNCSTNSLVTKRGLYYEETQNNWKITDPNILKKLRQFCYCRK